MLKLLQFVYRKTCHQNNKRGKTIYYSVASFKILEISHFRSENINFTSSKKNGVYVVWQSFVAVHGSQYGGAELRMCDSHCVDHRHHIKRMRTLMKFASNFFFTRLTSLARASPFRYQTVSMSDAMSQRMIWVDLEVSQKINKKNTSNNLLKFTASRKKLSLALSRFGNVFIFRMHNVWNVSRCIGISLIDCPFMRWSYPAARKRCS